MSDRLTRYRALIDEYLAIVLPVGGAWEANPRRREISDECGRLCGKMTAEERGSVFAYQKEAYERRVYGS